MKIVYFDCIGGAAGDMLLGALLDAGADLEAVKRSIVALGLSNNEVGVKPVVKSGLRAVQVQIDGPTESESPRSYRDIVALIESAPLDDNVRALALRCFEVLARAEARVHNEAIDDVHFHEVGAIDSIIDIVGGCAALRSLEPDRVVASPVPTGRGWIDSAHGRLPLPAPAVLEILRDVPLIERGDRELVTPTGASLLVTWCDKFGSMPSLRPLAVGYGAGTADLDVPNVVRVIVGEGITGVVEEVVPPTSMLEVIETNIDDTSAELLPYVVDRLIAAGAQDAWFEPIGMKKDRVGMKLSVLGERELRDALVDILFHETTTFGVRIAAVEREILDRKVETVDVAGHSVRVKLGLRHDSVVTVSPEYEDAAAVARATGVSLREVYDRARRAAEDLL